jgi:hypothetical protein
MVPMPKDIKIVTLDTFTRNCLKLTAFFSQLEIMFTLSSNHFSDNYTRILYFISLLRDSTFNWLESILRVNWEIMMAPELCSFASFARALKKMFEDFDAQAAVDYKLEKLHQTSSARVYVSEFRQTTSHLFWDNEALIFRFYVGLKDVVKDCIVEQGRLDKLSDLMQLAV